MGITSAKAVFGTLRLGDRRVVLGHCLGRGSSATVYAAILESAQEVARPVACKVFDAVGSEQHDMVVTRIAEVVRRAVRVRHPNVASVFEMSGSSAAKPFIISELVDGISLRQLLDTAKARGRRVQLDLALFIALEIAEGLEGARVARGSDGKKVGLLHRNLSARDVLLSRQGEVKVTDFGLFTAAPLSSGIRSLAGVARRSDTNAPEVARGEGADERSDVFSLGVLLREMLVGPRFAPETSDTDALRYTREGYVHSSPLEPNLPPSLKAVISRALEIDPSKRFLNGGSLARELRGVALGLGVGDARVFLRTLLEKEQLVDLEDTTAPDGVVRIKSPRR